MQCDLATAQPVGEHPARQRANQRAQRIASHQRPRTALGQMGDVRVIGQQGVSAVKNMVSTRTSAHTKMSSCAPRVLRRSPLTKCQVLDRADSISLPKAWGRSHMAIKRTLTRRARTEPPDTGVE